MKTLARAQDKADVLRRLQDVAADSPRRWGRMTAHQMVCHLNDSLLCGLGRKPVSHAQNPFSRTVLKWLALYFPLPWPRGRIRTRPEIDQHIGGTRPAEFAADVAQLRELVELVSAPGGAEWQAHPRFGRMSIAEWLRWGYLHMDHHLRQFGA